MNLNDVNLSSYLLTNLYPESLVTAPQNTVGRKESASSDTTSVSTVNEWKSLGNNQRNVLVGVNYEQLVHLPDADLNFLTQLLKACQLSLNDVAVINLNNYKNIEQADILSHFNAQSILLFGVNTQQFGFPFDIPHYQVQNFSNYTIIHAPSLQDLQNDKAAKSKLWAGLKIIFNV